MVDEAAINALVEQRVAEALAKREIDENQQAEIRMRQANIKAEQDRALHRQASAAEGESAARIRAGTFGDSGRIALSIQNSSSVAALANEIHKECYGA